MTDKYTPTLADFILSDAEKDAIEEALKTEDPWDGKLKEPKLSIIKLIKDRIRSHHMLRHKERCCYCRKILHGEGHFTIDREHILPKSIPEFKQHSFTIWNLGASCKRCNMEYKKDRVDFVVDPSDIDALQRSDNYLIIHPNFDHYKEHISRSVSQDDDEDIMVVKYTIKPGSTKGPYTYEYFNLRGLEINSFDEAQGLEPNGDLGVFALEAETIADDTIS